MESNRTDDRNLSSGGEVRSVVFDRAAEFYDETRGFPPGEEVPAVALFVRGGGLTLSSRVLEIGIGTGRIGLPLSADVGTMVGIDLSRAMMGRIAQKQPDHRIQLAQANAVQLPFPADTFDAVVATHVFHLIANWQSALREIARVLKPHGLLLHGGYAHSERSRFQVLWDTWEAAVPSKRQPPGVPRDEQDTFLEAAGWRQVGEPLEHHYAHYRAPSQYLDQLTNRVWSSTWGLTDAEMADGLAAVRLTIEQLFSDPDQPMIVESSFRVAAYSPPSTM